MTWDDVRHVGVGFAHAEKSAASGTPAIRVGHKMFVRLHQDGEHVVVRMPKEVRAVWLRKRPDTFLVTGPYQSVPYVLVRLATVTAADLKAALQIGWNEVM